MAAPEPEITDEDIARLRALAEDAIKKGLFGITVVARELLQLLDEIKRLRVLLRSGPGLGAGGPAPPGSGPNV